MKNRYKFNPAWFALTALVLVSLACSMGNDSVSDQPALATPGQSNPVTVPTGSGGLSPQQRADLISSSVRLLAMFPDGSDYSSKWSGSGTIISPNGYILTNAHVAKPSLQTGEEDPAFLLVGMIQQEDKAPVYSYIAEVVGADGFLDLALLRIIGTADGTNVDPGELNLPYVNLGNSDDVRVGDHISIFGFPGIGGETITFTSGNFGGWVNEEQVGDRAWMKLDATIAGGNSGGMVASDSGAIIGVPTIASSGANNDRITDCRVIQDTNGDGQLDENDTCIPIGGFINGARPINLAKALILAAENGQTYASPFKVAGLGGNVEPGSGSEQFGPVTWVTLDSNGSPESQVDSYPSGTQVIAANFDYSGMTDGQSWGMIWYLEGQEVGRGFFEWSDGPEGVMTAYYNNNDNSSLADGNYSVEFYAGTGEQIPMLSQGEVTVGGGGLVQRPDKSDGIQIQGTIVDNDTQRGINGALFIVLNPGVSFDQWESQNYPDSDIFTLGKADSRGDFALPDLLQRGVAYVVVVAAEGYTPQVFEDVGFNASDPAVQEYSIPLTQQ